MIYGCERFIDRYLRGRFGEGLVRDLGEEDDVHQWHIEAGPLNDAQIVVTPDALRASPELLERWLEFVVDDARESAPVAPGYYFVEAAGVSVRGLDRIDFEEYGQAVHCWVDDASCAPVWQVAVDGTNHGEFRAAEHDNDRDRIAAAAVDYLKRHSLLGSPGNHGSGPCWTTGATNTGYG